MPESILDREGGWEEVFGIDLSIVHQIDRVSSEIGDSVLVAKDIKFDNVEVVGETIAVELIHKLRMVSLILLRASVVVEPVDEELENFSVFLLQCNRVLRRFFETALKRSPKEF